MRASSGQTREDSLDACRSRYAPARRGGELLIAAYHPPAPDAQPEAASDAESDFMLLSFIIIAARNDMQPRAAERAPGRRERVRARQLAAGRHIPRERAL